jgi:hypothetical protein
MYPPIQVLLIVAVVGMEARVRTEDTLEALHRREGPFPTAGFHGGPVRRNLESAATEVHNELTIGLVF